MIRLDVAKAGAQLFSLNNVFNARVHDGFTPVKVQWINSTDGNKPLDVKGMRAFLKGRIGQGTIKDDHVELEPKSDLVSWEDDSSGSQPDGITLIKLPPQVFTRDGVFYGYIGLMDASGTVITSINIWFNVDQNIMTAGANVPYYLDEIQAALSAVQSSNDTLQNARKEIQNQIDLSKAAFQPEAFENEAALKAKYPAGASGLMVTVDTGHKWLWINGVWKDCGIYQAVGIPTQDIPLSIIAYFDSQNIPTWDNSDPDGNIDFSPVTGVQIRGQQSAYFDIKAIMQVFTESPLVTIDKQKQTISGKDFTLIYDNFTHKLSVTNLNGVNLDGGQAVLWAHYYANNVGLLVDNAVEIEYHIYTQTHNFWTAYLAGGYDLNYRIWDNDPDLYFPADIELYSPDHQYEIKKADILAAAKAASGIVSVDDNNHIHGDTFTIQFNLKTKQLSFKKAMGGLDKNSIVLFLHHYSSVNAGMLVDTDTPILIKNFMQKHPYWTTYLAGGAKLGLILKNVNPDLYFGSDLEIYSPDNQYEVKQADILAAAKAASGIVSVDDNNHIHGDTFTIQFNLKTKKLVFKKAMGGLDDNSIVLFLHHYSSVNAGPLMDYYLSQGNVGGSSNSLPSYWQTNVSEAIDRVNTNLGEAGPSGLSFLFITDQHWDGNQKKSSMLVHDVMSQTGVQLMANGGDLINQGWKPNMRAAMTSAIESVQYPGVFMATVFGNHDSNWVNVGDQHQHPERQFSHNDVYGYMMSPMVRDQNLVDDFHFVNAGQDFTYTFSVKSGDGQVWRWICVDTGTDGPVNATSCQKISELLENSANENIILFAHIWTNNGVKTQFTQDIEKLIDARNGLTSATVSFGAFDFSKSAATSKVIMALGGHEHTDNTWTTTGGVPFILTDSDNADRSESANKQPGTINEQCFDIFTVDPVAKQIKTVRVGRGEDRQFTIK